MKVYFVRHVQTDFNKYFRPKSATQPRNTYKGIELNDNYNPKVCPQWFNLSKEGIEQTKWAAITLFRLLGDLEFRIYYSVHDRTQQTALPILEYYEHKKIIAIEDMKKLMKEGYYILTSYYYPHHKVDHFVVVNCIDNDYIYFNDPFFGPEHKYKLTYFQKVWRTDPKYDNEKCWFIGVKKN